ncbi:MULTISPECIES: hypothetical protein [Cytobacillus]|jgi:ABC-type phosphate transport system permease subunit|uniref:Uncharacterized protein n=1 Tax=Cytobacillus firmus TaxID=1399 RepID=A0AA46SJF9_CYTFI|nr:MULTISPECIES: hypothetical protein [Cytobacillus]KML46733.1 hypothetical protein VL14_00205 [Cytobacillus firmus]MCC3646940.1 hypothetical protein [Cytobacillus oceanisediminis]MCU1806458.1 hypothetical protein [Cytobacillus firmus]UYG95274.1 hypothetical protein OD459_24350 [Cytobacillus firmus]WHY32372.1 hypothetical protein QNH44_15215 [Cytobacillus firmus]
MIKILGLILIFLFIAVLCLYFISRHKKQAVQVFTFESFLNAHHWNESADTNKNILDSIKGFFDEVDHAGNGDESNTGDSDDGGDDGGE